MNIPIFDTYIHPSANQNVAEVLQSTFLSEGSLVQEFEAQLSKQLSLINPVAVNSGTSALHLALILAGVKEGDEVITTAQTFIATGLAILYQKAIPIFADIQYNSGNISPQSIERKITAKTKAILVVHWGGYPCDMTEIQKIARKNDLTVIEDAAHALGAEYKGQEIGSISEFTCFSFQAIKHLTTGDGGALCARDKGAYQMAKTIRWFGIDRRNTKLSILGERKYDIAEIGYKYHLNDYSAALGLANLNGFSARLAHRRKLADFYRDNLKNINGIQLFANEPDRVSAYWLFGFHVEKRNEFIKALKSKGITASVIHQRIDTNSIFGGINKDLENLEKFNDTQIHIPIHDSITYEMAEYIVDVVNKGW